MAENGSWKERKGKRFCRTIVRMFYFMRYKTFSCEINRFFCWKTKGNPMLSRHEFDHLLASKNSEYMAYCSQLFSCSGCVYLGNFFSRHKTCLNLKRTNVGEKRLRSTFSIVLLSNLPESRRLGRAGRGWHKGKTGHKVGRSWSICADCRSKSMPPSRKIPQRWRTRLKQR